MKDIFLESWNRFLKEAEEEDEIVQLVIDVLAKDDEFEAGDEVEIVPVDDDVINEDKKKPDCKSGNKYHNKDGHFSTKANATSWAGGYEDKGPDCYSGKFKTRGGNQKLITKHPCGRDEDGVGKHPHKCKDGEPAYQEALMDEDKVTIDSAYLAGIVRREVKAALQGVANTQGCSFQDLLRATAAYAQAEKGGPKASGEK